MNDNDDAASVRSSSTRTRALIIGGVVPVLMALVATVLMFGWLPELPNPIAVHWSGAGADGFGPAIPFILAPFVIVVLFSAFAVTMAWKALPTGGPTVSQKILLTTSLWLASLLSIGFAGSVEAQRGLLDAHDAPDIGWSLALGAGVGLALAVAGWFLLPPRESNVDAGVNARPIDVRGEERISWSQSARLSTTALLIVGSVIVVGLVTVIFAAYDSAEYQTLGLFVVIFVVLTAMSNFWWHVSADQRGFIVKGLFSVPRKRIRLENIRSVKVIDVEPTRDFGGWGWRWTGDGRSGVILRPGPSIEVTQTNGKQFIVTVDDAATGAGVLAALVTKRSRS